MKLVIGIPVQEETVIGLQRLLYSVYTEVFLSRILTLYSRTGTRGFEIGVQEIVTRVGDAVIVTGDIFEKTVAVYVVRILLNGPSP